MIGLLKVCLMRDCWPNKIFVANGLFCILVMLTASVSAESRAPWGASQYVSPAMSNSYPAETTNPWHQSETERQSEASSLWSQQKPRYKQQDRQTVFEQVPDKQPWVQVSSDGVKADRYVTPEIIESLNRQEAQFSAPQYSDRVNQYTPYTRSSKREQQVYGYSAYPNSQLNRENPAYDVPVVSPWGNAPDILYRDEGFSRMPNEAIGGLPPFETPLFFGNQNMGGVDNSATQAEDKVFNPFTFLQNGK